MLPGLNQRWRLLMFKGGRYSLYNVDLKYTEEHCLFNKKKGFCYIKNNYTLFYLFVGLVVDFASICKQPSVTLRRLKDTDKNQQLKFV